MAFALPRPPYAATTLLRLRAGACRFGDAEMFSQYRFRRIYRTTAINATLTTAAAYGFTSYFHI